MSRSTSFSLERSASDDSMRSALPASWRTSDHHSFVCDVDEDSEPWELGAAASSPRLAPLAGIKDTLGKSGYPSPGPDIPLQYKI